MGFFSSSTKNFSPQANAKRRPSAIRIPFTPRQVYCGRMGNGANSREIKSSLCAYIRTNLTHLTKNRIRILLLGPPGHGKASIVTSFLESYNHGAPGAARLVLEKATCDSADEPGMVCLDKYVIELATMQVVEILVLRGVACTTPHSRELLLNRVLPGMKAGVKALHWDVPLNRFSSPISTLTLNVRFRAWRRMRETRSISPSSLLTPPVSLSAKSKRSGPVDHLISRPS